MQMLLFVVFWLRHIFPEKNTYQTGKPQKIKTGPQHVTNLHGAHVTDGQMDHWCFRTLIKSFPISKTLQSLLFAFAFDCAPSNQPHGWFNPHALLCLSRSNALCHFFKSKAAWGVSDWRRCNRVIGHIMGLQRLQYRSYISIYIYIYYYYICIYITYAYICCCMLWSHITLSVPSFSVQCSAWGLVRGRCGRTRIQSFYGPWW